MEEVKERQPPVWVCSLWIDPINLLGDATGLDVMTNLQDWTGILPSFDIVRD